MKPGLILLAILAASLGGQAFARLGNSEEQVAALLGKPTEIGKPDSDGVSTNTYEGPYYIALVPFVKGHSVAEAYSRKDHGQIFGEGIVHFPRSELGGQQVGKETGQETGLDKNRPQSRCLVRNGLGTPDTIHPGALLTQATNKHDAKALLRTIRK